MLDERTQVGSVTLRVADADEVARLYENALCLRRIAGGTRVELSADEERPLIVLEEAPNARRPRPRAAGLFHTAILFPERSDLADALQRVTGAGFRLTGASDHGVSEALYLDDPEGNGVELYWDRPRDMWPWTEDGGVAMFTAPLDVRDLLSKAQGNPASEGVLIGHVHLKVADTDRALGFWRDSLGMGLRARLGDEAVFLAAGDYHHHVGANTWQSRGGPPLPEGALGLERVTLALPDAAAVDQTAGTLSDAGVDVHALDGRALARDSDGVLVELSPR